ncbi:hypothetical protein [Streptomyces hoynatensis]|uniref:DUF1311 domain-containing protein n=1 Tax=Streptomyces hoynatensis TaxID=1141874 RepID=A0A3A9Z9B6_9ACTN|nr:hypothetical protein [Streptomyces hoynatensis]RKN43887.1 hypothetical protein D7294_09355 [Streptomyces hoynatensis]
MSIPRVLSKGVGAVLLCGTAALTAACGSGGGSGGEAGPGETQTEWADKLTNVVDSLPSACAGVGPECSGYVTALDMEMNDLDAAIASWDDADRYQTVRDASTATHEAADNYDNLRCMTMSPSDLDAMTCQADLQEAIQHVNEARDRLLNPDSGS